MEGYFNVGVARAEQQAWQPKVSMDNPNFHHVHPKLCCLVEETGYRHLLLLPKYSPDLHQIVEHPFGGIKQDLVNDIYRLTWDMVEAGGMQWLRDKVVALCERITPEQVEAGLQRLTECYKVVAAPRTGGVLINDRRVEGVEGGRPPKAFR